MDVVEIRDEDNVGKIGDCIQGMGSSKIFFWSVLERVGEGDGKIGFEMERRLFSASWLELSAILR